MKQLNHGLGLESQIADVKSRVLFQKQSPAAEVLVKGRKNKKKRLRGEEPFIEQRKKECIRGRKKDG